MAAELRDVSIGTALHASMVELTRAARDLDGLSAFGRPVIVRASTEERAAVIDFKLSTSPPTTVALTFGEGQDGHAYAYEAIVAQSTRTEPVASGRCDLEALPGLARLVVAEGEQVVGRWRDQG
ncbi:MAG: hypothetical protein KC635_29410 [Myxococcales bacterium]|nr:hypothetical protein [Myxococcales bacterium]MCB9731912.1 hypothetical protein [Deltaproteobacteria bacterium]